MKYAVFIERDGVLNHVKVERRQQVVPLRLEHFHVKMEAVAPLNRLREAGFEIFVTTNQPGLSTGMLPRRELDRMHELLRRTLPLTDILVCPHDDYDSCPCRKPRPGLFYEAAYLWHLDLDHSYVVSDKWQDAQAAEAAGCTSLLIQSPWNGQVHRDLVLSDLDSVASKIIALHTHRLEYFNGHHTDVWNGRFADLKA